MTMIDDSELDSMDFREFALPIGVRLEKKEQEAWVALDKADWLVLYKLLTTSIGGIRAVDESNSLQLVARFALGAVRWYDRTKTVAREQVVEAWVEQRSDG